MISVAPLSRVIISCIGEITIAQNSRVRSSLGCLSVNESFYLNSCSTQVSRRELRLNARRYGVSARICG